MRRKIENPNEKKEMVGIEETRVGWWRWRGSLLIESGRGAFSCGEETSPNFRLSSLAPFVLAPKRSRFIPILSLSLSSAVEERFRAVCVRAARACAFDAERKKSRRTDGRRWQTFQFECRFLFGSSRVGGWVFSLTFSLYLFRPVLMAAAKFSHNLLSASSLALCVCVCVSVLAAPFLRSLSVCSSGWLYAVPPRRR